MSFLIASTQLSVTAKLIIGVTSRFLINVTSRLIIGVTARLIIGVALSFMRSAFTGSGGSAFTCHLCIFRVASSLDRIIQSLLALQSRCCVLAVALTRGLAQECLAGTLAAISASKTFAFEASLAIVFFLTPPLLL